MCPFLRRGSLVSLYQTKREMNSADSEVKLLFIQEELSKHGEWLCDVFTSVIEKNKNIISGDLLDSVNYSAFKEKNDPGLRFNFFSYGRAFEIAGYKRNRMKSKVDVMQAAWGEKENRPRRKQTNWYAKNMFGGYYKLVSRIMYGLSDAEIARLKGIIENRKQQLI